MRKITAIATAFLITGVLALAPVGKPFALAQGAHNPTGTPPADAVASEDKMRRRFPQPVRVAALIGARVLDYDDVTLGRVREVVRTPDGKISLIVDYGGWF